MTSDKRADFTQLLTNLAELDDSTLLTRRAEMRAELDRLPPLSPEHAALTRVYTASTAEITDRARRAWAREG